MSFTSMSPLAFGLGLAALAGVLYLLQRLRVRHREVPVVTTLFWHEAVHETRARVRTHRFRHPWAYALILAIASLLWAAAAGPVAKKATEHQFVCLLDSSAGMRRGELFESARLHLIDWVESLPRESRTVLAADQLGSPLLLPGEESSLLEGRWADLEPVASPCSIMDQVAFLARIHGEELTVYVFGGEPLEPEHEAALPSGLELHFISGEGPPTAQNFGITALGCSEAASGAWDTVDVFVEVRGTPGSTSPKVTGNIDGSSEGLIAQLQPSENGLQHLIFRDVSAQGGLFTVSLEAGDGLELDNEAQLRLPSRPRIRVSLSPELIEVVGPALHSDPAVVLVDQDPDVTILTGAETSSVPTLRFVPAALQAESFLLTYEGSQPAELVLSEALGSLGLADVDPTGLASRAQVPITLGARSGNRRELAIWSELLGDEFDFRDSRAFPLFVARALRWLGDTQDIQPWVGAGEPSLPVDTLRSSAGHDLDAVGLTISPPLAGKYTSPTGDSWHASLLTPVLGVPPDAVLLPDLVAPDRGPDLVSWLLMIALLLLAWEWALFRTEQIP